jgi:hypothetical protein
MERAKSLAALTKSEHVYVVSNIGSFGEQVFQDRDDVPAGAVRAH